MMRRKRVILYTVTVAIALVFCAILNPVMTVYADTQTETETAAEDTEGSTSSNDIEDISKTDSEASDPMQEPATQEKSGNEPDQGDNEDASSEPSTSVSKNTSDSAGTISGSKVLNEDGSDPEKTEISTNNIPNGVEYPENSNTKETDDSQTDMGVSSNTAVSDNTAVSKNSAGDTVLKTTVSTDKASISSNKTTVSDPSVITAIDPPEISEVTLEFKTTLDSLQEELPEAITVHRGETEEKLQVSWNCAKDYNKTLEEYPFVPDLGKEKVLPELTLPTIIIHFVHDGEGTTGGYIEDPNAYGADIIGAGRGLLRASASSYNGYTRGNLPSVRSQGSDGACWAFASIGAAESDMIHDGTSSTGIDLSEIHLAYYATHDHTDPKGCRSDSVSSTGNWLSNGGNAVQAYRILANHVGAVKESDAPYRSDYNPGPGKAFSMDYAHVKNAYRINPEDREAIKSAIQSHYGVTAAYADYNIYYSSLYASYYCNVNDTANHAVMLVGWDDNFPSSKFSNRPPGNGAWLVRNSWGGRNYCHEGYFWLSYYDKSLLNNRYIVVFDADRDLYDNCYAYDGQPVFDTLIPVTGNQAVSQTYHVSGGETIKGVGYEVATDNVTARVTVTDKTHNKTVTVSNRTTYPGFYTVPVSGLDFSENSKVEVSIKYSSASDEVVEIVTENTGYSYFGNSRYHGVCDQGVTIGYRSYSFDPRMKLYTNNKSFPSVSVTGITLNRSSLALNAGQGAQLAATITPSNATNKSVTWSSSNTSVATVNSNGYVTAVKAGTAVITARTVNNKSAACTVTVKAAASVTPATPNVSVFYRTHVENIGWQGYVSNGAVAGTSGRSLRLEGINIYLSGNSNLGVQYTTHCQDYGWLGWSANNEMSGTEGEAKRLEAIMINLTGSDRNKYDIYYRVHAQDVGWMGWAKNGGAAGTAGYARRLEAIQIQVVKKGASINTKAAGIYSVTSQAYISTGGGTPSVANSTIPNLSYRTHVQDVGWQTWRSNGQFAGTSGQSLRLEGINIKLSNKGYSGGIRYKTHVQDIGWQDWRYDGAMSGTSGRSLRLEAINIELYGDMSKYYDIYYRVHAQDVGWMGWAKNGASSGTAGYARRLEGIQIVIVNKGASAPGASYGGIAQNDSRAYIWR